jgi:hypothetical protein
MHPDGFERNREAESIASGSCARLVYSKEWPEDIF